MTWICEMGTLAGMRFVATRKVQRYTRNTLQWPASNSRLETTHKGGRCDWVEPDSVYVSLGMVRVKGETGVVVEADDRVPPEPVIPTREQITDYLDSLEKN